jgi:hypothetical protein
LNYSAIEEMNYSLGQRRVPVVMGHHADGGAAAVELGQQFHDCFTVLTIQITRWLIG